MQEKFSQVTWMLFIEAIQESQLNITSQSLNIGMSRDVIPPVLRETIFTMIQIT